MTIVAELTDTFAKPSTALIVMDDPFAQQKGENGGK
jgi:hypothetical protein